MTELHELLKEFFNYKGVVHSPRVLDEIDRRLKVLDDLRPRLTKELSIHMSPKDVHIVLHNLLGEEQ